MVKKIEYTYYVIYLILLIAYNHAMWSTYGLGLEEIKFSTTTEPFFDKPIVMLSFFMYYHFARNFLEIPSRFPIFNKKIKRIEYVLLGYTLLEVILLLTIGDGVINEWIFHSMSAFNLIASIWCVVSFMKKQKTPLNYFILVGVIAIITGAITSLILIVINPALPFPPIIIFPCFVLFEIIVFTTGLAYKSRLVEKERFKAEQRLVEELREKEYLQKSIQELRNKIAGDLHDDLGSTLGSLAIYAEAGKKNLDSGSIEKTREVFNRMYSLATDSIKNLREMVWIITPGNEKWEDMNNRMENYGKDVLAVKSISFKIDSKIEEQLILSVIQRRNLYLIFKECIHNILKHSNATNVNIQATINSVGNFVFSIVDDGIGTKENMSNTGHGLKSLLARSTELEGTFILENNMESGIAVTVEFPINRRYSLS
jgi:signal transduction histidine kinase